ncbi:hypothetical protein [Chromobacterium sp. IIBBL 290-4]|uniref:hypothetical protein n=1 Tax=Chromobacterium sp. IIBBL 290-4 TaxID=2953890 RepID=UPI0020B6F983|nr:hypothetical protein [Chromobacterium sp. IIBBL 290-4]UTH73795.1 hypothetical protein NKT35_19965 [Chromobacterium sp. IIBBL 290-4]
MIAWQARLVACYMLIFAAPLLAAPAYSRAYLYARDMINQFSEVYSISVKKDSDVPEELGQFYSLMSRLVVLRSQLDEFEGLVKGYEKDEDPEIRASSTLLHGQILILKEKVQDGVSLIENDLNDTDRILRESGTVVREIDEFKIGYDKAWMIYAMGGNSVSFGLVMAENQNDVNSKVVLKVGREEVDRLKSQLIKKFGLSVLKGTKRSTSRASIPAVQLWEFLNEKWEMR